MFRRYLRISQREQISREETRIILVAKNRVIRVMCVHVYVCVCTEIKVQKKCTVVGKYFKKVNHGIRVSNLISGKTL